MIFCYNYLNKLINGSIIVFIAIPKLAMAARKVVVFSIKAVTLEVAGWIELKIFCFTFIYALVKKNKISINLEIMKKVKMRIPIQDNMMGNNSLIPNTSELILIQKFTELIK